MIKYILNPREVREVDVQKRKGTKEEKTEVVNLPKGKVFRLSNGKSIFHSFVL